MANRRCPKCVEAGRDTGNDGGHMFLLKDKETWGCFRKDIHLSGKIHLEKEDGSSIVGTGPIKTSSATESVKEVLSYPLMREKYRGIREDTWKHYDVRCSFNEENGDLKYLYFPINEEGKLLGFHRRDVDTKGFINVGSISGHKLDLFGLDKIPKSGKKVVITEGHIDALTTFQTMYDYSKKKYGDKYKPNILSLNNGTGSLRDLNNNREVLLSYEEILLFYDMDPAGDLATAQSSKMLGGSVRVVEISEKDANELMDKGKGEEIITAFFSAKEYIPSDIVTLSNIHAEILEETKAGMPYPWESLNEITYGIFDRQIISVGAAAGAGKTVFMNQLSSYLIYQFKKKIALFSLEETPAYTAKKLIGSLIQKRIHLPGVVVTKEEIQDVYESLKDYLYIYDTQGYLSWEDIKSNIRYLASLGCSIFVIDPLTAVTSSLSASEANEMLNGMMAELAGLVQSLNITVFLVSHLNNPKTGKMHSEGGRVSGEQFTQSRAMYRWSHSVLGLERNLQSDDEDEKNTMTIRVIKNRLVGKTGTVEVRYDDETGQLQENPEVVLSSVT